MPGGEGRQVVHPDGSLTRVAMGAITTLAAGDVAVADDGSEGVVRLSQGALWHQPDVEAPAGQSFAVEIGSARIITEDATFAVIVEADGSSFLTSIGGDVRIQAPNRSIPVSPLEAAMLSPGGELLDSIQATPDEVMGDPWVGTNLTLSGINPADVRVPERRPRFEPRPVPTREPEAEAPTVEAPPPIVAPPPIEEPPPIEQPAGWAMAEPTVLEPEAEVEERAPEAEPEAEAPAEVVEPEVAEPEVVEPEVAETELAEPEPEVAEEEAEEEEYARESSRLRVGVAALLVLVGLVVVILAVKGLVKSDNNSESDVASTGTSAASSTTTAPGSSSTAPGQSTTAAPAGTPSTTTATGGRYTVHPTRCAQTGSQLTAEGNLTNLDADPHNYRVTVVFTVADTNGGTKQAASATTDVANVTPNQPTTWKATTTYDQDLSASQGGCKVGNVEILNSK